MSFFLHLWENQSSVSGSRSQLMCLFCAGKIGAIFDFHWKPSAFPGLMPEMAHTGENHRDVVLVSRGDHFIVADGAAWLNRAGRARVGGGD